MARICIVRRGLAVLGVLAAMGAPLRGAEHVTLKNGFEMDCSRREVVGDRVRLYLASSAQSDTANYLEVASGAILRVEMVPDAFTPASKLYPTEQARWGPRLAGGPDAPVVAVPVAVLTKAEMHEMLSHAGGEHNIDEDLLASVVRAESGGQVRAVSHAGAQGLMQLMPGTASELGVKDAFRADENIAGGTAYLDALLTRYHDNVALALAAYNAGPAAVDRYHGVPPYRETRVYVARVIREFNRRKQAARATRQVAQAK